MPPSRRKRYRYRLRRLTPVWVAVVLAGLGGAWVGKHQTSAPLASTTTQPRHTQVVHFAAKPLAAVAAERLLVGGSLLRHTFSPKLLGSAAVLVDGRTGRVLWARNAHERRQVASTTKIMTALLALRVLQPHDMVTVDKSSQRSRGTP